MGQTLFSFLVVITFTKCLLADLNDISQWNTLITSLTLPIPSPPRFTNVGLKSANIEWSSYFAPSKIDKTAFGFTLSVCEVENKNICFERTYEREKLAERFSKEDADIIVFGTKLEEFLTPSQEYIARCHSFTISAINSIFILISLWFC